MINECFPPGYFYSVIPSITKEYNNHDTKFINLDFNEKSHKLILNEINDYLVNFDKEFGHTDVSERQNKLQYSLLNGTFEWMDARLLHYFYKKTNQKKL
jgi:hypothetical protein